MSRAHPPQSDQLSPGLVRLLAQRGDIKRLRRGEVLIQEGAAADSLYILISGQLTVYTQDKRGREVIYNQLTPGDLLGEMFLDGGPRSASVRATSDVECIEVCASEIRDFMAAYPGFSETLVIKLIGRLRRATQQVRSLALDDVFARTISQIESLSVRDGSVRFLPTAVTQQQIASRIGATREMVNHVFRNLVKEGHLVRDPERGFVIREELPKG
jgi:CRP/FNR family transcriptional regulator, cyclic AMP receptor protein